jgi:uncharacterized protein (TIGR02996 family)
VTTISLHPEHASLLTDICANRGDLTPRLIYADWLEDHAGTLPGREEDWRARAEFIRLQCRLDPPWPTLPLRPEDVQRYFHPLNESLHLAEILLARHRHAWLDDEFRRADIKGDFYAGDTYAGDYLRMTPGKPANAYHAMAVGRHDLRWKWHAGFLDHLSCPWTLWDAVGDRLHAAWPVTEVKITGQVPVLCHHDDPYRRRRLYDLGRHPPRHRKAEFMVGGEEYSQPGSVQEDLARRELLRMYWPGVRFAFSWPS